MQFLFINFQTAFEQYGKKSTNPKDFYLFESFPKYGKSYDLLLSVSTEISSTTFF